ncbi:lysozyme inhibitor LprI family protein [Methylobacterium sp. NEAU 140]|uniref:lysozyme inhibitor LprI family protein n=1 Tax=Methylobacterium sp. NEAU 140 TaxID=3064945 RepID=UPI002735D732|nr:lysozyme inhibitor LprI family protein [Methylobacterium sp. NEAU 140]MDP4021930.1 lysozyme inhibitor LprI family protein [Methylobacterium sp. NEAU 140]
MPANLHAARSHFSRLHPSRLHTSRRARRRLLGACAAWSVAAFAASAEQPSAKLCLNETSTPATQACLHRALDEADARLNAAYRKALAVIDGDDRGMDAAAKAAWKAQLAAAQRAWIAFRDADCGDLILSEWASGSGATGAQYACRYDRTVQRTADLLSRYPLH